MCAGVVCIGPRWYTKGCSAPDGVVLACLFMLLWVQVCLYKDVGLAGSCPIPVEDLSAKVRDICIVQLVVRLLQSWSLLWTWVKRWIKVRFFLRWKHLGDLLGRTERVSLN